MVNGATFGGYTTGFPVRRGKEKRDKAFVVVMDAYVREVNHLTGLVIWDVLLKAQTARLLLFLKQDNGRVNCSTKGIGCNANHLVDTVTEDLFAQFIM